jgi:hypothetical protein
MCSTLDEVKLKEKGRAFHDLFLTKVSIRALSSGGGILFISVAKCQYLIFFGSLWYLNENKSFGTERVCMNYVGHA